MAVQRPHGAVAGCLRILCLLCHIGVLNALRGGASEAGLGGASHGATSASASGGRSEPDFAPPPLEKMSRDRRTCLAREDMDAIYFPIEQNSKRAVRMVLPGMPVVGDVHVILDQLQVTTLDLKVVCKRKNSNVFSLDFKFSLRAWFEEMDFTTPQSKLDSFGKGYSSVENFFGKMVGLGKDYGRVDRGPVDIDVAMQTDFESNGEGEWRQLLHTRTQSMDIKLGNGGLIMLIVNKVISGGGGVDQIFDESVWPMVLKLLPESLGVAFQQVPIESGRVEHTLEVQGRCPDAAGRQCPSQVLHLGFSDLIAAKARPEPIGQDLLSKNYMNGTMVHEMLSKIALAYSEGRNPFAGWKTSLSGKVELEPSHRMVVSGTPDFQFPLPVLRTFVSDDILNSFIPREGSLQFLGKVTGNERHIKLPVMSIKNLTLPILEDEHVSLSATVEEFETETDVPEGASEPQISLDAPGIEALLSHSESGFSLRPYENKEGMGVVVEAPYVKEMLRNATASLRMPGSFREGPHESADGAIPQNFSRPPARDPSTLDLVKVIKDAKLSAEVSLDSVQDTSTSAELFDIRLSLTGALTLDLDSDFFRGLLDSKDNDMGYVDVAVGGTYGALGYGSAPSDPAFLRLLCGVVYIYKAGGKVTPFAEDPDKALDVEQTRVSEWVTKSHSVRGGRRCFRVDTVSSGVLWLGSSEEYFCTSESQAAHLQEAIKLQVQRFRDAKVKSGGACFAHRSGDETCFGKADVGTWFLEIDPKNITTFFPQRFPPNPADVESPRSRWLHAKHDMVVHSTEVL